MSLIDWINRHFKRRCPSCGMKHRLKRTDKGTLCIGCYMGSVYRQERRRMERHIEKVKTFKAKIK